MMSVTVCMTMGRRPALLAETLRSLADLLPRLPVLAVNDFGDAETNQAFRTLCPHGRIVDTGGHVGHHPAVDALYACVTTPFVLHLEDDWHFTRQDFLPAALRLLQAQPDLTSVCLRDEADFHFEPEKTARIRRHADHCRFDALHAEWYGHTFNPHVARLADWQALGGYARFAKERHISRHQRALGRNVAFLAPGACHHIGAAQSLTTPAPGPLKRLRRWLRGDRQ